MSRSLALLTCIGLGLTVTVIDAHADIMGMTKSKQVSEPALVADPAVRDDRDTATTIDVSYVTTSRFITQGAGAYPDFNFLFAGQGLAANVPNIPDSDFTITQYTPWVVNNNMTEGFLTLPSNDKVSRDITNQDAGGANIVISYTPRAESTDPTQVNFVQAFIENINNAGFKPGVIDAGRISPYYNFDSAAGTGMTLQIRKVPLVANPNTPAWLGDIPFRCENGPLPSGTSNGCVLGADDTLTSIEQTFETFIESDQIFDGKTYQVLYGGVQWGYSYTNADEFSPNRLIPEPSSLVLIIGSLAILAAVRTVR